MLLLLAACGLLTRPTPTLPTTDMAPLPIDYETGHADPFLGIVNQPPDGAAEAVAWWHGPDGEKPPGATDRVGPPVGVATLLREDYAVWNILEVDQAELRIGGGLESIALQAGRVPDDELRGQLVAHLYEALLERIEGNKDFEGRTGVDLPDWRLGLRIAPDVPWKTMEELLFTAGQAQLGTFCFLGKGTYEALQQRCFTLQPIAFGGREVPPPDAEVVVRSGIAWRVLPEKNAKLDATGSALRDAPSKVLVRIEDPSLTTEQIAPWIGVIGQAGAKEIQVRLSYQDRR